MIRRILSSVVSCGLAVALLAAPAAGQSRTAAKSGGASATVRATLPNGLRVVIVPSSRLPLVDLRLVARAGSVQDPKGREGLARLTADLLTQGAGPRGAQELAEAIEFVGGELSATAGAEQLTVSCEVLAKDLPLGLELFRDVVVSPSFAAEEFARKKDETLGAIASAKSEPSVVAENALAHWFWGEGSPLAHPAIGWESGLSAVTRDDVLDFHRRFVTPERSVLVVVGAVEPKALLVSLRRAFAGWKPGGPVPAAEPYGPASPTPGLSIRVVDKPEQTQSQIRMICPSVPRGHPDWYAIQVANTILGAGFTSRLVNSIRVEQGLTYNISSRFQTYRAAGAFRIQTFTRNEKLRKCVDAVLAEVTKLVEEGPTTAEHDKARNYLRGQFPLGLQSPDELAGEIADVEFFGLPQDFIARYPDRIAAVSLDDVRRVLRTHFCTKDLRLLVVTNGALAAKELEGLGPIEVKAID